MNNSIRRIWLYAMMILPVILTGCGLPYCKKTQFTEDELAWMDAYNQGEMLTFTNRENGLQDTIYIEEKAIHNPTTTFWFDFEGCNWMEGDNTNNAIARYGFTIVHKGKKYPGAFFLKKTKCNLPAAIQVLALDNLTLDVSCANIRRIHISDTEYITGIYFGKNQFDEDEPSDLPLDYLIWNKEKGLAAYRLTGDNAPYILND